MTVLNILVTWIHSNSALKLYLCSCIPTLLEREISNMHPVNNMFNEGFRLTRTNSNRNESSIQHLTLWNGNLRLNSAFKCFSSRCLHTRNTKIMCMLLLLETLCCQNMSIFLIDTKEANTSCAKLILS